MGHLIGFVEELQISRLSPPRHPLRQSLENVSELMSSINESGLLHPIVVRVLGDRYEIVAGHRRYTACRNLRWTKIPCQVVEADDKEAFELALSENIQHETLSPIELARAFKNYVDKYGYGGETELARKIGRSEQYVSQYLQLTKLPSSVQRKLTTRVVNPAQAREMRGLSKENQRLIVDLIATENLTSRQVKGVVSELRESAIELESPFPSKIVPTESEVRVRQVQKTLGKCLASLRVCMMKFDDLISQTEDDEWILKEALIEHRVTLNRQIDSLIKLRKRILRTMM